MSDDELVTLLRLGSDRAFETLAARYEPRLLRFCQSMLRSREDAEDALQDVLISALRALRADDRALSVRPWLYRIARNRCINDLRRARKISFELLGDDQPQRGYSVVETVAGREQFRELVGDVQSLPDAQSAALLAREFNGHSYQEIASAMDTTVPGVKSLLFRARAGLRASSASRTTRLATCVCATSERDLATSRRCLCTGGHVGSHERAETAALSQGHAAVAA
jgi:RNA polymerase sigma factor (sigma-70 family)